jgi:hypothetical protein
MMDETYSIDYCNDLDESVSSSDVEIGRNNSFNASHIFNTSHSIEEPIEPKSGEEDVLVKKKVEFKLKLNKIRERTKLLLEKHNWKKYFTEDNKLKSLVTDASELMMVTDLQKQPENTSYHSFSVYNASNSTDSSSLLSGFDKRPVELRSSRNTDDQKINQSSKLNLFDLNSNSSLASSVKSKNRMLKSANMLTYLEDGDIDIEDQVANQKNRKPCISNVSICSIQSKFFSSSKL